MKRELNCLTDGTEKRVKRVLRAAGLVSMWGELKAGSWGVILGDTLHTVSNTEDCDWVPDPREVGYTIWPRDPEGGWGYDVIDEVVTLREALGRIAGAAAKGDRP